MHTLCSFCLQHYYFWSNLTVKERRLKMPQPSPAYFSMHLLTYNTHLHIHIHGPRSNPNIMSALSAFFSGLRQNKSSHSGKMKWCKCADRFVCVCVRVVVCVCICTHTCTPACVRRNYPGRNQTNLWRRSESESVKWFKIVMLGSLNHGSMFN